MRKSKSNQLTPKILQESISLDTEIYGKLACILLQTTLHEELPIIQSVSFNNQKIQASEIIDQQMQSLGSFRGPEKIRNNTSKLIALTQLFQKVDQERIYFRSLVLKMLKKKFWQINTNSKSSQLFHDKVEGVQREIIQKQISKLEQELQNKQEEIEQLNVDKELLNKDKDNLKKKIKILDDKLNEKNKEIKDFVLKKSESTLQLGTQGIKNDKQDRVSGRFTQLRNTFTSEFGRPSEKSVRNFKPRKGSQKKSFRSSFTLKKNLQQKQQNEDQKMSEYEPISDKNPRQQNLLRKLSQRKFARKFNN